MFVDEARIQVAGGRGGNGAVSFHREKFVPKGGPDGGTGGRGASVVLVADSGAGSLSSLRDHPHQRGAAGGPGRSNNRTGAAAEDLTLPVPPGTVVSNDQGEVLADLVSPGDRAVVARGGRGGRGNAAFASDRRRAPGFAEMGEPGEEAWIRLELRLIADVSVVGLPNAGKSTLVGAISRADPKVAAYPFTTLEPTLGVVESGEDRFVICDIPGLIEGAHSGKGLGLSFLRHARRALAFIHLIDLSSGRPPVQDYEAIRKEMSLFDPALAHRPELVVLNKVDLAGEAGAGQAKLDFESMGVAAVAVSAKEGTGLSELVERVTAMVRKARDEQPERLGFQLFRTEPPAILVHREGSGWRVQGPSVERWVAMADLANPEGVAHLQGRLERAGVERMLAEAGAAEGDEVSIGHAVFEWWPSWGDRRRQPKSS